MPLKTIRLELARTKEYPEGSAAHGYVFTAPLDAEGHLNLDEWKENRQLCMVHRFWVGEDDEHGELHRTRGGHWVFSYEVGEDDDGRSIRLRLRHFLKYAADNRDDSPLYVFDSTFHERAMTADLLEDYSVPRYNKGQNLFFIN